MRIAATPQQPFEVKVNTTINQPRPSPYTTQMLQGAELEPFHNRLSWPLVPMNCHYLQAYFHKTITVWLKARNSLTQQAYFFFFFHFFTPFRHTLEMAESQGHADLVAFSSRLTSLTVDLNLTQGQALTTHSTAPCPPPVFYRAAMGLEVQCLVRKHFISVYLHV